MNRFAMLLRAASAWLIVSGTAAHAEVKQASADGFFVVFGAHVAAAPAKTYSSVVQVQNWWSGDHTWSGKAANLSLNAEAGGCFCERWPGGSAEHGRVIMALPDKLLRLESALGPLQEFALDGILSFWVKPGDDGGSDLSIEYRVNGSSGSGLDELAPKVDDVLGAQFERLTRYIDSGNPDATAAPTVPKAGADPAVLAEWARQAQEESAAAKPGVASKKIKPAKPAAPKSKPADGP
jgi:uncharacterized protein YndB with AHSA1/START domain